MRFERFEIKNFKGIDSATLDLLPSGAGVFTLIGLNESGKTTILEAVSKFDSGADEPQSLYQPKRLSDDPNSYVPKHLKSNFTGQIVVSALALFEGEDKDKVVARLWEEHAFRLNPACLPDRLKITRAWTFSNSDFKGRSLLWGLKPLGRAKGERKDHLVGSDNPHFKHVVDAIWALVPEIVYFPTFLFEQPKRIVLNPGDKETDVNRLYRQIIMNLASSLPRPLDIKTHIVDRVISSETPVEQLLNWFTLSANRQQQITAALDEMSSHLTETVFTTWSKVFTGSFSGRELILRLGVEPDAPGIPSVYIEFFLKDGVQQYDITERSLGFRWFFSFLLFTLYRVPVEAEYSTLFLLDEPASNLHSRAQMQLIGSFPRIASGGNQIIYSTHSHYMINPEWLDQAFIVSNDAIDYEDMTEGSAARRRHTEIRLERYRSFVGQNPDRTTYFQPVLDKLEIVPSRFDLLQPAVIVEGKGDYLILEYGRHVLLRSTESYTIIPTRGAEGCDELIGLLLGWNVPFTVCLDSDRAGEQAKDRYLREWALSERQAFTLRDIDPSLADKKIEDLLEHSDIALVQRHYRIKDLPTKGQIQLFFSEKLALREKVALSGEFKARLLSFDKLMSNALKRLTEKTK